MRAPALLDQLRLALMLLTRLPAGHVRAPVPLLGATTWAWPLAGAVVGVAQGLVLALGLAVGLPSPVAALIAVAVGLALTGGLHEDGLADLADGLGGGRTRDRRLAIMRDSRIGSHGAAALIVALGLRGTSLAALSGSSAVLVPVAVAMLSRATLPALLLSLPPARGDGLGAAALAGSGGRGAAAAAVIAVAVGLLLLGASALLCALAAAVAAGLTGALARQRLGGVTGDVLGAAQIAAELGALVTYLALTG